ncbi:MAG: hypothetical protein OEQ16_01025 [Gammaproteobacteria bacterium]|jgi:hypothetical protein|nr:hypothetical protein [Gammaproteobacteria bacterium]MDH3982822.1 hypothetical protein [Gammaproteobacteria bacterium]HKJ19037.1 hypothetical protein [Woeseiaceae bacterium]
MRYLKILIVGLLLAVPTVAAASGDIPESAVWYFHLDLEQMREKGPGQGVYDWLKIEALAEIKEEAGVDLDKELDRLTAFSQEGQGPVMLFEGNISQETKDKIMTFVAAGGDLTPLKASGKTYYHFAGAEEGEDVTYGNGDIEIDLEQLEDEAWVSLALKNKVLVTGSEEQMKSMLANGGKVAGSGSHKGALLVLSAEKTMLQAGMNSAAFTDDGDSGWDSNILRNTEQVAFMMAAAANKLALEAKLITTEPEMAESLASVVRGLISLVAFNDEMDAEVVAMLQGTKVEASGNSLSISLALAPELVVQTLSD